MQIGMLIVWPWARKDDPARMAQVLAVLAETIRVLF